MARVLPPGLRRTLRRPLARYRHTGLQPADVLLVSYPKSGSTWLRFLLAHALTSREADFDSVRDSVPPAGRHRRGQALLPRGGRLVKSHEPLRPYLGRRDQPVIYLVRDGRDVALSFLDHERRIGRFDGDAVEFVDRFLAGAVGSYGAWNDHVLAALELEHAGAHPFLRVRYEDLRQSPVAELARILEFLGIEPDPGALADIVAANTKDRMRAKEATSAFLASMTTDGTPFVRPERPAGWSDLVPEDVRTRSERALAPVLRACGYTVT
ncbi:MAG: sulfotransferase domain-containing protein [Acidimicrobiales bacterium]